MKSEVAIKKIVGAGDMESMEDLLKESELMKFALLVSFRLHYVLIV